MANNVIQIEEPAPLIFVCNCGCSSFSLFSDGSTECQNCGVVDASHLGAWETSEPVMRDDDAPKSFQDVSGNGSVEFARARISRLVDDGDCVLVVVAKEGGALHAWSVADTQDRFDWVDEKLASASKLIRRNDG